MRETEESKRFLSPFMLLNVLRVTAIVMLTEVPVAALSSALIAGEVLQPQVIAGGLLIVLSSLAAALSLRREAGAQHA